MFESSIQAKNLAFRVLLGRLSAFRKVTQSPEMRYRPILEYQITAFWVTVRVYVYRKRGELDSCKDYQHLLNSSVWYRRLNMGLYIYYSHASTP